MAFLNKGIQHAVATKTVTNSSVKYQKLIDSVKPRGKTAFSPPQLLYTAQAMSRTLPKNWHMYASCGIKVPSQIRMAHTDVTKIPDFSAYRVSNKFDEPASKSEIDRRMYSYTILFGGAVIGTSVVKSALQTFLGTLNPSAKALAEASIEVDLSQIPEGRSLVFKWRNKPLFVRHRTAAEIEQVNAVNVADLRDPAEDSSRVKKPEWLILVGICTHLGCVPIANAGEFGGYYCPCHGSHYDASGRIRKGPAPENLEVPSYEFLDENTVKVG